MENIILRQFQNKDTEAVYNLHVTAMKEAGTYVESPDHNGKHWDTDFKEIENVYIRNNGEFFVVTVENEIVGMGALRKVDNETAEIKRMRVKPTLQGKGIGKLILDKLIKRAKELKYKRLILDVPEKQKMARHLYETRGFKEYKRGELADQETIFSELNLAI